MRNILIVVLLFVQYAVLYPQIILTIEGEEIIDTETGTSSGYNIPRNQVTNLTFRNNSMTSVNSAGYMLQAGDETPGLNNNHLDGATITGNSLTWNGTDDDSWTHAMFTGYNLGVIIKYNYLSNTPNGIQRKSNGMTDNSGVVAYNIIKNPKVGIVVKGMNGVRIYNNTLYCEKTTAQTSRGLIDIHTNTDNGLNAASTGVKVFNNIFYTKYQTYSINVMDQESLVGFESDYNVFYCESGSPLFNAGGVPKTFLEWQALGYDIHSVIINPAFNNFTDFVPANRLNYGINLGDSYMEGLATDATWGTVSPKTAIQNGIWQVGARVFAEEVIIEDTLDSVTSIFPNPASGFFYILNNALGRTYQSMIIYDSLGNIVMKRLIDESINIIEIPANFTSGLYNIVLDAYSEDRYIKKLLIIN